MDFHYNNEFKNHYYKWISVLIMSLHIIIVTLLDQEPTEPLPGDHFHDQRLRAEDHGDKQRHHQPQ